MKEFTINQESDVEAGQSSMKGGKPYRSCHTKRTVVLRTSFLASMIVATSVCAALAYSVTHHLEEEVARATYESVATRYESFPPIQVS